ncbi:hypothetical protein [Brassicibacter mesophilus]
MDTEKKNSIDLKKCEHEIYFKVVIAGLIGGIFGIIAYTNNWLG